ncbi:MAG: hypothetical protein R2826_09050 [Thermoleophilia bacterium]
MREASAARDAREEAIAAPNGESGPGPLQWVPYILGLALQVALWFLLFLAIAVAVIVGSKLTEFRYVGF